MQDTHVALTPKRRVRQKCTTSPLQCMARLLLHRTKKHINTKYSPDWLDEYLVLSTNYVLQDIGIACMDTRLGSCFGSHIDQHFHQLNWNFVMAICSHPEHFASEAIANKQRLGLQ